MKCPYCRGDESWRMKQPHWMKFTPGPMRNMRCSNCGAEFTKWFLFFPLRGDSTRKLLRMWHVILLFGGGIAVGFLIPAAYRFFTSP